MRHGLSETRLWWRQVCRCPHQNSARCAGVDLSPARFALPQRGYECRHMRSTASTYAGFYIQCGTAALICTACVYINTCIKPACRSARIRQRVCILAPVVILRFARVACCSYEPMQRSECTLRIGFVRFAARVRFAAALLIGVFFAAS